MQRFQVLGGHEVYEVTVRDDIRDRVLMQRRSQLSAARRFAVSRDTAARLLRKMTEEPVRGYRCGMPRSTPVRDQIVPHIEG